jgi:hypothetical protein
MLSSLELEDADPYEDDDENDYLSDNDDVSISSDVAPSQKPNGFWNRTFAPSSSNHHRKANEQKPLLAAPSSAAPLSTSSDGSGRPLIRKRSGSNQSINKHDQQTHFSPSPSSGSMAASSRTSPLSRLQNLRSSIQHLSGTGSGNKKKVVDDNAISHEASFFLSVPSTSSSLHQRNNPMTSLSIESSSQHQYLPRSCEPRVIQRRVARAVALNPRMRTYLLVVLILVLLAFAGNIVGSMEMIYHSTKSVFGGMAWISVRNATAPASKPKSPRAPKGNKGSSTPAKGTGSSSLSLLTDHSSQSPPLAGPGWGDENHHHDDQVLDVDGTISVLSPVDENASIAFQNRWCDLRAFGSKSSKLVEWYPNQNETMWQRRAPSAMIIGAKYSGTNVVAAWLQQHSNIFTIPHASLEADSHRFVFTTSFASKYVDANEKTRVSAARARLFARDYPVSRLQRKSELRAVDVVPSYLFHATILPRRLFCISPWVKLLVVLRNPVDRTWAHYVAAVRHHNLRTSFEDWIHHDIESLEGFGLFNLSSSTSQESQLKAQDTAWYSYTEQAGTGPIGRSLYVIQLRQWFQAIRAVGMLPQDVLSLVRTEDIQSHPREFLQKILRQVFNLKPEDAMESLPADPYSDRLVVPRVAEPRRKPPPGSRNEITRTLSDETRQFLEHFFAKYNKGLANLLQTYGMKYVQVDKLTKNEKKSPNKDKKNGGPKSYRVFF